MIVADHVDLAGFCTLGVGGAARWFVEARTEQAVVDGLAWARERNLDVHVLGGGSNVVVADDGFPGLVVHVNLRGVEARVDGEDVEFAVAAGEPWDDFVAATVADGCAGLECLSGIPGLAGGTPVQNVGAYGQDVSQTIARVHVVDRRSRSRQVLSNGECAFAYRSSRFKRDDRERFVVTRVDFRLPRGGRPTLAYADVIDYFARAGEPAPSLPAVRQAVLDIRRRKGMVIEPGNPANHSVGSFFVNPVIPRPHYERIAAAHAPVPHYPVAHGAVKVPAAWLIERAGFPKGLTRGPVGISPFQSQAIVNHGGARAADVVRLAADVKRAVADAFGVVLVPEPVFVGFTPTPELDWLLGADAGAGAGLSDVAES